MITQAALQGLPWAPVLWGVFFAWLGWRLNIVGSFYKHAYDKRGKRLPGPHNAWPFGFVWQIREWRKDNVWWIKSRELFQEHGPLIAFRVFSSYSLLVVDPEFVRQIVTGSADLFPKGHLYQQLGLVPGGLFTSNGPKWRRDRRILNPKFQYDAVMGYMAGFNAHTQTFVDAVRQRVHLIEPVRTKSRMPGRRKDPKHDGKSVVLDMLDAFSRLTLDIILDAGFGHVLGSAKRAAACVGENHQQMEPLLPSEQNGEEGDEIALAVRLGFEEVAQRLTDPLKCLKYLPHRHRRTEFARKTLRRVIEKAVGERAAGGNGAGGSSGSGSLLDLMMEVHDRGTWTTDQVMAQSMTFLIAGHETTSALLAWTLLELGEDPSAMAKLRAEVDAVVGGDGTVEAKHVDAMPYMRALFKEALRLHPPVTVFSRRTEQDLTLGEYLIPAGWHVGVSVYCLHRHPALWARPDDFWPERWLPSETAAEVEKAAAVTSSSTPPGPSRNPQEVTPKTKTAAAATDTAPSSPPPALSAAAAKTTTTTTLPYEAPPTTPHSSKDGNPLKSPFQYVPFSLGPRSCIGQRFALLEASVILARIVRDFDLELIDKRQGVTPLELLTVRPSRLLCRLTPRVHVPPTMVPTTTTAVTANAEPNSPVRVQKTASP